MNDADSLSAATTSKTNRESSDVGAIAEWMRSIESREAKSLSRGGVFCIELRDRSEAGGSLNNERLRAIWSKVHQHFGGAVGLGFLGSERAFAVTLDESQWASLAACVVQAAVAAGIPAHDIGVGVGFARQEMRGQPTADVLRLATTAASYASDTGIGFSRRSLADEQRQHRKAAIQTGLEKALEGEEGLRLIFQPKVDAVSGKITGAEALLRFECDEIGPVSTMELLDVAEACGELERLDRWALGLAVESLASFQEDGVDAIPVSVNVRAETAFHPGFTEFLAGTLATFGVKPSLLEIEIREDQAMQQLGKAEEVTRRLSDLGVATALDGFGRNRTTLADLRRLRVSTLKLDRGIVREMMSNPQVAQLAHGMMHLSRVLQMQTVAVGIETEEQRSYMRDAGCSSLQGFLFFSPMEGPDLLAQVRSGSAVAA
ncbi:Cyclic di-GMP phosphodiesterase Gmr [Planctomycetes bacterium Poly30]|uniref:Cyclic di-GMP phosphodiesterase Gmr n=1 Tax=Saltatorellus ferox TaxID=2528018 RepID=A0A518EMN0_9BACT|nr:Cyclic di-GMP phosphodiesterase Gmr [Planctomycetes bacterium Poly30]